MAAGDEQAGDHETAHARSVARKPRRVVHLVVPLCWLAVVACTSEPADIPLVAGDCQATDPHDEDGDGIPDACDVCPSVFDPAQEDTGEMLGLAFDDRVGDACDPQPTRGGDKLAVFDAFATDTSSAWQGEGWHIGADVARAIAPARWRHEARAQGDGLYVQAQIPALVWLAAGASVRVVADDGDGVGYACAVVRDRDGDGSDELELADGAGTPTVASLGTRVDPAVGGPLVLTVWRLIDFHRAGTVVCHLTYAGIDHQIVLAGLDDFGSGVFAFAADGALVDVASLTVYTFPVGPCASANRACPSDGT